MKLVGRERLLKFKRKHPDTRLWFDNWIADVEEAQWKTPADIKARYARASILPEEKGVIFDVKGNDYRMHVKVNFKNGIVLVIRVGNHREYDRWIL
ncbi:MAG: type II toxin-antitoxin system HigB family toxin [Planctomycetes bacterium]|nr:type II toxin-antitoxin system HigB family toxin [Planctomycetota bacterium]